jgi:2-methylcitrate dehydratase PrpD
MRKTIAEILADFTSSLEFSKVPDEVRDRAKMRILDFLGVALAGSVIASSRIMTDVIMELGGKPESTVIGQKEKVACTNAALANGTMAHASDYDDDHRSSTMHPGSAVVPAALAMAEREGCGGVRLIEAVLAGYEVACRVGDAFLGTQYDEGFHPTGTCGVFASAAAAAKIIGLPPKETVWAFGIAGAQAAGLEEWKADGSWTKRMHPGKAAQSGILAVLLAQRGYTGPATIFEGKYGFLNGFSYNRTYDTSKIIQGLGEKYRGHDTAFKPYPCCRFLHQIIDGVLEIVKEQDIQPEAVKEIRVRTFKVAIDTLMKPEERRYRPQNVVDAQFSIPFTVGAAVARRRVTLQEFTDEAIKDRVILGVAAKVKGEEDPECTKGYPEKFPTIIEMDLTEGRTVSRYVDIPSGDPSKKEYESDPSRFNDDLISKIRQLIGGVPGFETRADNIVREVRALDNGGNVIRLMTMLQP